MPSMMQTIKRIFSGQAAVNSADIASEQTVLPPEQSLKRASKNLQAMTEMVEQNVTDAVVLNEDLQLNGKAVAVEVRSDKILMTDANTHQSRLIRLNEENLEPYQTIDIELRLQLGQKIARLTPQLAHEQHEKLLQHTIKVLKTIAQDQSDRVRALVAEELCDQPNAPHEVISKLANDHCPKVAFPILEFSPLLGDAELINILQTSPIAGAAQKIAKRPQISGSVSDAIIATKQEDAIGQLLSNEGAEMSQQGLEHVIALAPEHEAWHQSLATRPELTQKTIARIAQFMSQDMLMQLHDAGKIKRKTKRHTRAAVNHRLNSWSEEQYRKAEKKVQALHLKGMLDDEVIDTAIEQTDEAFVTAALAMRAMFTREKTKKILRSESARAITALAWEAGLPMRSATALQRKIGQVHHTKLLHARGGTDYPLTEADMQLYLDIFS